MNDLIRIVWMGKSKPGEETTRDATWAETRARELREFILAPEYRASVRVIYPYGKDKSKTKESWRLFE